MMKLLEDVKVNLMEISHRDVEELESYRFKLIRDESIEHEEKFTLFDQKILEIVKRPSYRERRK